MELHSAARAEFDEAADRYESERPGLGAAFIAEVRRTADRAAAAPLTGSPYGRQVRRMLVRRFPYALVYAVESERVFVVAVAHHRRRPRYWGRRL